MNWLKAFNRNPCSFIFSFILLSVSKDRDTHLELIIINNFMFRMKREVVALVLFSLGVSTVYAVTPADCEDSHFHSDPDNCPSGYFRCYPQTNVRFFKLFVNYYEISP